MKKMVVMPTWLVFLGGVVVVLAGLVTVARGSIPSATGVLHGCYLKNTGQLRLIDVESGATCTNGEFPVSWNTVGPQGAPGTPGISGYEIVSTIRTVPVSCCGNYTTAVFCPTGKKVLGGGYHVLPNDPDDPTSTTQAEWGRDEIWGSLIQFSSEQNRGLYSVFSTGDDDHPYFLQVYATCAFTS